MENNINSIATLTHKYICMDGERAIAIKATAITNIDFLCLLIHLF